jgi:hypothetical protein
VRWYFEIKTSMVDWTEIDEPMGWDSAVLTIKRDIEKYHGLFFGYSTELELIGNGQFMSNSEFELRGFDGYTAIKAYLDCGSGRQLAFWGEFDYSTFEKTHNHGCSIKMSVTQSSVEVLTVNRQDIVTDLEAIESIDGYDISGNSFFDLLMHNYTLNFSGGWENPEGVATSSSGAVGDYIQLKNPICIGFDEIGGMSECQAGGDTFNTPLPAPDFIAAFALLFTAPRTSTYVFEYSISGRVFETSSASRNATQAYFFGKIDSGGAVSSVEDVYSFGFYARSSSQVFEQFFSKTNSFSVSLLAGERIYLPCRWVNYTITTIGGGYLFQLDINQGSFINIREGSTYPATYARSSKLYDAFWKCISNYTGSKDSFYSLLLGYPTAPDRAYVGNGCASYTALTNGYKIRGFPDKKIVASLTDLFDSTDAIFNLGMGFEVQRDNVIRCRVEEKAFFYSNQTLLAIFTDVMEIKTTVEESLAYNQFKLGFQQFKVEEGTDKLNTNDEFLTQFTWSTVSRNIKNTLERFSKYISSLYIIEYTRRNRYLTAGTKESKYDEANFLIAMNRNGAEEAERDEKFANVFGINYPSEAYNMRFNLFSTLLRWSNIFNASVSRLADKVLKFTYGSINNDVTFEYLPEENCEGNYSNQEFTTNQDLYVDDTNNEEGKPIYEPIVYDFEYPLSVLEYNRIRRYPNGTVIFGRNLESLIQAFILEVNYRPNEGMASFRLLRSYEQNVDGFFPVMPTFDDLKKMGVIVEYFGTLSIFDDTGLGTGTYDGYALCNGNNGTPDLRGQFIVSYNDADPDYNTLGNTGGTKEVLLTAQQSGLRSHNHAYPSGVELVPPVANGYGVVQLVSSVGNTTTLVDPDDAPANEAHENRPPYFVLAKIMFIGT